MQIKHTELKRFHLQGKLGEGADSEAFAANDTKTGLPVVIKRPHPTLIMRAQHSTVERRIASVIDLRERLGNTLPHVAKVVAYAQPTSLDDFFGDALGEKYSVVVEERALGIPLVGSAIDGIKRHPIGAPQNLFAIHPIVGHSVRERFSIVRDLLEVADAFIAEGALILDMRPQNIYFEPATSGITVIDIGGVTELRPARGRKPPLDLHDFYLELFKWYVPLSDPPLDTNAYRQPVGMESVPMFNQNLDSMIRQHSEAPDEPWHSEAIAILLKIKARGYPCINAFRRDFEPYLLLLEERYECLSTSKDTRSTWRDALRMLTKDYWQKFLFEPGSLKAFDSQQEPHT